MRTMFDKLNQRTDAAVAQTSKSAVSRVSQPAGRSATKSAPAWTTRRKFVAHADLEIGDTAALETCATAEVHHWGTGGGRERPRSIGCSGWLVCWLAVLWLTPVFAAEKKSSKPDTEAEYTAKLEVRAGDILTALDLQDAGKAARVRGLVIAQYRALRDWHDGFDAKLKGAGDEEARGLRASLKELHGKFIAGLAVELTAAQIERVKDRMTYDKVRVTYDGYVEMLPQLTAPQRARVMELLKEAREEAMDGGSSDEKTAIFGRYKGRINNFLSADGYDLKQAGKDWAERRKLKEGKK